MKVASVEPRSRLTNGIVKSGTCDAGVLRLFAVDGGEGGVGTETGVISSRGGAGRPVSS